MIKPDVFTLPVLALAVLSIGGLTPAFAQVDTIEVNVTQPCFLNYSAGYDMWRNCGASDDYIAFSLVGWEWVTGGYFSLIFVGLFSLMSYQKYHKAIYPMMIGVFPHKRQSALRGR